MTKKLTTISLIIFCIIVTAILSAGLVFYQNKKDNQATNSGTNSLAQNAINQVKPTSGSLTLSMTEIAKHNKQTDCWMLISGKVYNITSYFGSHPGGNSPMTATCGIDATAAYATKNAGAKSSGGRISHSSNALSLLTNYYIGDLNQIIGTQKVIETNTVSAPISRGDDDEWDD